MFPGLIPQVRSSPAVFGAFHLACGIWVAVVPAFLGMPVWMALGLGVALWAAALVLVRANRVLGLFFPLGLALAWLHLAAPWNDYTDHLARHQGGAGIRGVVVDSAYSSDELDWLLAPTGLAVRVTAVRPVGAEAWVACGGTVLLRADELSAMPYGTRIEARGAFLALPSPVIDAEFDYGRYLRIRGIHRFFDAQELTVQGLAGGRYWPMRLVYSLRESCAESLVRSVDRREARAVLLAMTLGYRRGLSGQVRRSFIRSGVVHVFAISGLHVGIAAALVGAVLQLLRLPYRFRFALLPVLVGVYMLMTGAAPSAVRAWLMISVWSVARARLHPVSPVNTVAVAAVILLLANPLMLFDPGFVFSFAVVGVLVLGWTLVSSLQAALGERWFWLPRGVRGGWLVRLARRFRMSVAGLLWGSVLAWLGSAGLLLGTQALLIPGAIFVNAVVAVLVWWVILLAGLKMVLGAFAEMMPMIDSTLAAVLSVLVAAMEAVVAVGRDAPMSVSLPRPEPGWVAAYYAVLAGALILAGRLRRRLILLGLAMVTLAAGLTHAAWTMRDEVAVFQGGDTAFPVIVADASERIPPVVVNAGAYWTGVRAAAWLGARGVQDIDALVLSGWGRDRAGGVPGILSRLSPRTLMLPDAWASSAWLSDEVEAVFLDGVRIREYAYPWREGDRVGLGNAPWRVVLARRLGELHVGMESEAAVDGLEAFRIRLVIDRHCGGEMRLQFPGGRGYAFYLPFQLRPSCYRFSAEHGDDSLDLGPAGGIFDALSESGP